MKDYKVGLLRHRCSNKMRIGKFIKVFSFYVVGKIKKLIKCPNCKKLIKIEHISFKPKEKVLVREE